MLCLLSLNQHSELTAKHSLVCMSILVSVEFMLPALPDHFFPLKGPLVAALNVQNEDHQQMRIISILHSPRDQVICF